VPHTAIRDAPMAMPMPMPMAMAMASDH